MEGKGVERLLCAGNKYILRIELFRTPRCKVIYGVSVEGGRAGFSDERSQPRQNRNSQCKTPCTRTLRKARFRAVIMHVHELLRVVNNVSLMTGPRFATEDRPLYSQH